MCGGSVLGILVFLWLRQNRISIWAAIKITNIWCQYGWNRSVSRFHNRMRQTIFFYMFATSQLHVNRTLVSSSLFFSRIKTISTNLWKCIMNQVPQFGRTVDALHSHSLQWTTMHEVEGERRSNVNRWFIRYGLCKWFFLLLFFCGRIKWMNPFRRKFIRVLLIQHRFQVEQKSGEIARCIKYKVLIQMNIYTR